MKTLHALTALLLTTATPVFAADKPEDILPPEQLLQLAQEQCTAVKDWSNEAEVAAFRACIPAQKVTILMSRIDRIAKACGNYDGDNLANCVDWVYLEADDNWTPQLDADRRKMRAALDPTIPLKPDDPAVAYAGKRHVEIERQLHERATRAEPTTVRSTATTIDPWPGIRRQPVTVVAPAPAVTVAPTVTTTTTTITVAPVPNVRVNAPVAPAPMPAPVRQPSTTNSIALPTPTPTPAPREIPHGGAPLAKPPQHDAFAPPPPPREPSRNVAPTAGRPPGGISLRGTSTAAPGQLNVQDDVLKLAPARP
jgi:hypothetical protein